jgi:hypothetical protein
MTKRQGIRAVLFLFVVAAVLFGIDSALRLPKDVYNIQMTRRYEEIYSDETNTWDGILLGTSEVDRAWSAPAAWEEQGITVYPLSTDGNPFVLTANIIEEVLKYQNLSFVVVDLHGARPESLDTNDIKIHRVTDHLKWSSNRIDAIRKVIEYTEEWSSEENQIADILKAGLYFPIIKYHSRLTKGTIYAGDLDHGKTQMKGVYEAPQHIKTQTVTLEPCDEAAELLDQQKYLLDDVIECAEKNDLQLVFLKCPSDLEEEEAASINAMAQYVESLGYPVLNFNDADVLEASGIDGNTDFFDEEHMNTKGSRVFTSYFAAYLKDLLNLEDHRGDERYKSWDEAAEVYEEFYADSLIKIEKWKQANETKQPTQQNETQEEDAQTQ